TAAAACARVGLPWRASNSRSARHKGVAWPPTDDVSVCLVVWASAPTTGTLEAKLRMRQAIQAAPRVGGLRIAVGSSRKGSCPPALPDLLIASAVLRTPLVPGRPVFFLPSQAAINCNELAGCPVARPLLNPQRCRGRPPGSRWLSRSGRLLYNSRQANFARSLP